jgi:protein-tyrosine phosphatase
MNFPFHKIVDNLFLGNELSPEIEHFDFIVNCTKEHETSTLLYKKKDNFSSNETINNNYVRISIKDNPYESDKLLSIIKENHILEQMNCYIRNNKNVLVHCVMGMQRSCTVVAFYLIKYYNMSPEQAINFIKSKRPVAFFGNVNFRQAIHAYYIYNKNL